VGIKVERVGDHRVEAGVARLAGGCDQSGPGDDAKLGTNEDAGPLLRCVVRLALGVAALGAVELTWSAKW
jgi:hypothetical protein